MKQLRDYQAAAIASVMPLTGRPLIVLPTGSGKSLVNAHLAANNFTGQTLCLTHVRELVQQNEAEMRALLPEADIGVFCAGLGRKESSNQIVIGSVASVFANLERFRGVTECLIDEAHRVSIYRGKMYRDVLRHLGDIPVCGLTATPFRLGTGYLHEGEEAFFDRIAYEVKVNDLIAAGYLAPLYSTSPEKAQLPTEGLAKRGGEFTEAALAELVADYELTAAALRDALTRVDGRKSIWVYACNVEHAKMIVRYLRAHGEEAEVIHGELPLHQRDALLARSISGKLRWLVNVNILTTGANFPSLDCIVVLRPTASPVLYVQIYGRGTRTAAGKPFCQILDYCGNVARHGMFDDPGCGTPRREPISPCANCGVDFPKAHVACPLCGAERAKPDVIKPLIKRQLAENPKIDTEPHIYPILADGSQWRQVRSWAWKRHESKAGNLCLKITYSSS